MKLPQAQLALDPGVAKLHHSSATAVLRLRFDAGHLFPERNDRRSLFQTQDSATVALIFRAACGLAVARLAVAEFGLVEISDLPAPVGLGMSSLWPQLLSLRTNIAIRLRLIDERAWRKAVRSRRPARRFLSSQAP